MRSLLIAATLLSSPALALQTPTPGKEDSHICDVKYDPNDVTDVPAIMGNTVAIKFFQTDRIVKVTLSDTGNLKRSIIEGSNMLYLKAMAPMPPQPIMVRTLKEDGTARDYTMRWTSLPDETERKRRTGVLASMGPNVIEVTPDQNVNLCYLIRYNYPSEVTAAQVAAWKARQAKQKAEASEIALHNQEQQRAHNVQYTGQGDASIGPTEVYDDGYTTTLVFPGNMRIPTIFKKNLDGTDAEVTGTTTEQGGVVKIHEVLPFIRLRDADQVLCITNWAYSLVGENPGTGTTSPDVARDVAVPK